jgi:hypothetical protein
LVLAVALAQTNGVSAEIIGSWLRAIPDIPPAPALPWISFGQFRELVGGFAVAALLVGVELLVSALAEDTGANDSRSADRKWQTKGHGAPGMTSGSQQRVPNASHRSSA